MNTVIGTRLFDIAQHVDLAAAGTFSARHIRGEIGEVLNGQVQGRSSRDEVTIYKSLGIAAPDLAVAHVVYERARQAGLGMRAGL